LLFSVQFEALKSFMEGGGSILILLSEGGESKSGTNINYFLEELGMVVNPDSVVSTVFRGGADKDAAFVHPKARYFEIFRFLPFSYPCVACKQEVLVTDGILNREINRVAGKKTSISVSATSAKNEQRHRIRSAPPPPTVFQFSRDLLAGRLRSPMHMERR
jgi:intraflagellar transport protein 52